MVLVLMGVSGSGKTTVGEMVATRLGWRFEEGDLFHSPEAIEKMRAGRPLIDQDRAPWLDRLAERIGEHIDSGQNAVITCSALKRSYRDVLNRRGGGVVFAFLWGERELIASRVAVRQGHFMPASLLESQFGDLEPPRPDEPAITVDVGSTPDVVAQEIVDRLAYFHNDS